MPDSAGRRNADQFARSWDNVAQHILALWPQAVLLELVLFVPSLALPSAPVVRRIPGRHLVGNNLTLPRLLVLAQLDVVLVRPLIAAVEPDMKSRVIRPMSYQQNLPRSHENIRRQVGSLVRLLVDSVAASVAHR